MKNATKKLIASLVVVLMGGGIVGAAYASWTKTVMVRTYPGVNSVGASVKNRFLFCNNVWGVTNKNGVWFSIPDKQATVSVGEKVLFEVYSKNDCIPKYRIREGNKVVPNDGLKNFWLDTK